MTWGDVLERWDLVEADLHQVYGIDIDDRELRETRTWRWLRVRIGGLLTNPDTRICRALAKEPEQ